MTTSPSRRARRSGSWRAALTVPALAATTLLVPAFAPAAGAAVGDAVQSVQGYCDNAPDLGRQESADGPVEVNLPPTSADEHAGRAHAARQIAASYAAVEWDSPDGASYESCSTNADYTQKLTVGAGTSGLPVGAPVTLRAEVSFAGTLDTSNDLELESDALTSFFADYVVEDLTAECAPDTGGDDGCYEPPAVELVAEAERNTWSTSNTSSDPDGYLWRSHEWSWSLRANTVPARLGDRFYDEAYPCPSFPCTILTGPGELPSSLDPLTLDLGTKTVDFTTTVGAVLQVRSGVDTFSAGADGPAHARADVLGGMRGAITGLPGSGVEVLLGTAPFPQPDETAPTVEVTADPAPNAAGWNDSDVTVLYAATDEEGGSGVERLLVVATGANPVPPASLPVATAGNVLTAEGITEVRVTAQDVAGNVSDTTTRTVRIDKTAPVVSATAPAPVVAGSEGTAVVSYTASATDALDSAPALSCTAPSGTAFPVGATSVTCTATDHAGNTASRSFDVVVTAAAGGDGEVPSAERQVRALIDSIEAMPLHKGVKASLTAHLRTVERSLDKAPHRTCSLLAAFRARVEQRAGKGLDAGHLTVLRTATGQLVASLDC